jgi:dUTP pyrophosphatase
MTTIAVKQLANGRGLPLPAYQSDGAAGFDLCAAADMRLEPGAWAAVGTGIAVALPAGTELQVRPRSGLAARHGVTVLNAPGTVDSDYRGEITVLLVNHGPAPFDIRRGDRIAQGVLAPVLRARFAAAEELDATARGPHGFGSTGL